MAIKTAKKATLELMAQEAYARFAKKEDVKEYSIVKKAQAEEGYTASYNLTVGGTAVGETINIPKDYLVKAATLESCSVADKPLAGYKKGEKYIDFVVNSVDGDGNESHIYLKVQDLVPNVYQAGAGISIEKNESDEDAISIKLNTESKNGLFISEEAGNGLGLLLATETAAGAMSAEDKKKLNAAITEQTEVTVGEATGSGNVITGITVEDNVITPAKGITALTEDDLVDFTQEEITAIFDAASAT